MLIELPEKCPICGAKMERGTLRSHSSAGSTAVYWGPFDWGYWSSKGKKTERIGYGFVKVDLKGFRCAKCKVLVLSYGEDKKKE